MKSILLAPPVAFILYLLIAFLLSRFSLLSSKGSNVPGKEKAYACGEDVVNNRMQPGYSQFYPFAFFFTIMHVVALIIATVPTGVPVAAIIYLLAAIAALRILFRGDSDGT